MCAKCRSKLSSHLLKQKDSNHKNRSTCKKRQSKNACACVDRRSSQAELEVYRKKRESDKDSNKRSAPSSIVNKCECEKCSALKSNPVLSDENGITAVAPKRVSFNSQIAVMNEDGKRAKSCKKRKSCKSKKPASGSTKAGMSALAHKSEPGPCSRRNSKAADERMASSRKKCKDVYNDVLLKDHDHVSKKRSCVSDKQPAAEKKSGKSCKHRKACKKSTNDGKKKSRKKCGEVQKRQTENVRPVPVGKIESIYSNHAHQVTAHCEIVRDCCCYSKVSCVVEVGLNCGGESSYCHCHHR